MAMQVTPAPGNPPPVPANPDTTSTLPRALRNQIARSDALLKTNSGGDPGGDPPTPAPAGPTTPSSPTNGAQPAPNGQAQEPPSPNSVAAQGLPTQPDPGSEPPPGDETWEQRMRSLEGRYRADMQRSAEVVTQLQRELAGRVPPQPVQADQPLLTEAEIADYGPEFVDLVRRVATEASRPLQHKIGSLEAELQATGRRMAVSANDQLHQYMAANLPQWTQINNSQEFIDWSRLPDVYSGAIRQALMQDAWNKGDGPRVLAFFTGFLAELQAHDPQRFQAAPAAPHTPAQPQGSPAAVQPRVTLESLAAPGRARSTPPQPVDKPVYTQAQILQFYTDVATNRFRGTPAEREAIDRDISAAQHEGRIIVDTRLAAQPPNGFTR